MGNESTVKVVKILATKDEKEVDNKVFEFYGTAFFIDSNTLVTAKHVIREAHEYGNIYISELPEGGVIEIPLNSIEMCEKDIVYFKIKKSFKQIDRVLFSSNNLEGGTEVQIKGFKDKEESMGTYDHTVVKTNNKDNIIELQNHLTNGLSGSPLLFNGKIYGIAHTVNRTDNITSIMPISELCIASEKYYIEKEEDKKTPMSLSNKIAIASMLSGLLVGVMPYINVDIVQKFISPKPEEVFSIPICLPFNLTKISMNKDDEYIIYSNSKKFFFKDKKNANNIIKFSIDNKLKICSIPNSKPIFQYMVSNDKVVKKTILNAHVQYINNKKLNIKQEQELWSLYSNNQRIFVFLYENYAKKAEKIILDNNLSEIHFLEKFTYLK